MPETQHNPRDILVHIHEYVGGKGFFYTRQAIANLYLALKTKPFVILTGPSGTGKTQLVRLFAEAIGYRNNCLMIPVRPDWTDSSELLGYRDLKGNYQSGRLIALIQKAHEHPKQLFFVILDEMNLARVEYYLPEFLSVLETRRWNGEQVITDSILGIGKSQPSSDFEGLAQLGWPANLYLIGTVNMDDTTHPFSPKVLDRAQTIEFSTVQLDWPVAYESIDPMEGVASDFLATPYLHANDLDASQKKQLQPVINWLNQINDALAMVDLSIGYRVRDEVAFYMMHRMNIRELVSEGEALDRLMAQKILPRIQGTSGRVSNLLVKLMQILAPKALEELTHTSALKYADLYRLLGDPVKKKLPFPLSLEKLLMMYQRLEEDGYTSYWL